ncbi:unnamed protein product [Rotaria sp. Silwood1]|nr:unnamed protein product [Rotaria sp. Silwood1]
MINPDNLQAGQIQRKLQSKDFILIQNGKNNHGLWNHDISLIGQINAEGAQEIFDGWAACNHCFTAYRTHSKTNTEQNRKNYGLRPFHAHLKECKAKQNKVVNNIQSSFSTASSSKASTQPSISQFAYNKNLLNENLAAKLKDAELKFVVTGSHSFNTLENGGLLDLLQVGIEIGAKNGLVNVRDIFYGRKTIRQEAINKFELFVSSIRCLLDEPVKRHCIAATCDLGSNDIVKRSYLDFTVFMSDDNYQLHHCLLRCKHFPNETKTAINIWNEIKQIFQSFGLSFGDTPIVTDQGANMVAAFKLTDEARFPCMAHRCHTTIKTAWDQLDTKNTQFSTFNTAVKDIRKYVQRSGGIQENLEKTIKSSSGTRPWRSYFNVYGSLHTSYKQLLTILRHRNQQHRLYQIDPDTINMLSNIANSLFVIPASSAESERYFSIAGQIVTEQRSLLDPDTIEALVVLKEAYINNIWPASVTETLFTNPRNRQYQSVSQIELEESKHSIDGNTSCMEDQTLINNSKSSLVDHINNVNIKQIQEILPLMTEKSLNLKVIVPVSTYTNDTRPDVDLLEC